MAVRLTHRRNTMAGIASVTHDLRARVVGEGTLKTYGRMTQTAFRFGIRVRRGGRLARGHRAVVTTSARSGNTRMIKATVRFQFQKMGRVVAVITIDDRRHMKFGFADGQYTVVTFAAIPKYFQMIDKGEIGKSQRCMTGLAHIAGSDVIQRLLRNRNELVVMAIHTD